MTRYELSLSPDYVPNWTEVEAVRELFQNALDAEGEMSFNYDNETLSISSEGARLDSSTLLMGSTTKADEKDTIGHFGEGYKLAFLVLARMGYTVNVHNMLNKTHWTPKIIKSRRYNSDLLVVDVTKALFRGTNLVFHIEGIKPEVFDKISQSNLHIAPVCTLKETAYGNILEGSDYKGKIFIKGLYVCTKPGLEYGYDILPEFLETNRDRNLVSDFNIAWITSQMWGAADKAMLVSQMVKEEVFDVRYINSFAKTDLNKLMHTEFIAMHGKYAVPVADQKEYDFIRKTYKKLKPVFVKPIEKDIVYAGGHYIGATGVLETATRRVEQREPHEILEEFFQKHKRNMTDKARGKLKKIVELSKEWTLDGD